METGLSLLEKWYRSQCNGLWEHSYGVKVETLDNPGWRVTIRLNKTKAESRTLDQTTIDRTEDDWIHYWVKEKTFQIYCGPLNLSEAVEIFVHWFDR